MPKHGFMISKAVDLVARKLAGMDTETIARLTQVLSEEALMISDELQNSGEKVNSDILAARLEGLVARMKYEVRNQGPDPSPNEFPIFNVSHNPASPYPNPINHLYDKRYKEAYSTFIKQNQAAAAAASSSQKTEPSNPSTPASPSSSKPTANPNTPTYPAYSQGQQQSNQQPPHPAGFLPELREQQAANWQYMNPYATMPRSHAAYYQQQAAKLAQSTQQQPPTNVSQGLRHSSTSDDMRAHSLSRSASGNELNYTTNSGKEKIRVRVINDNSASSTTDPQINPYSTNGYQTQSNNKETIPTRTIYTSSKTELSKETIEDLFKVVNNQRSDSTRSTSSPVTERIIIIDRRGSGAPDNNANSSGTDRYRTFEVRTSAAGATPTTPITPTTPSTPAATAATTSTPTPTPATSTPATAYAFQQPNYFPGQQMYYQQPKMYTSAPNMMYPATTPYVAGVNNFYPFGYYRY